MPKCQLSQLSKGKKSKKILKIYTKGVLFFSCVTVGGIGGFSGGPDRDRKG